MLRNIVEFCYVYMILIVFFLCFWAEQKGKEIPILILFWSQDILKLWSVCGLHYAYVPYSWVKWSTVCHLSNTKQWSRAIEVGDAKLQVWCHIKLLKIFWDLHLCFWFIYKFFMHCFVPLFGIKRRLSSFQSSLLIYYASSFILSSRAFFLYSYITFFS